MNSNLLEKIEDTVRRMSLKSALKYSASGISDVPYEQCIVTHESRPNQYMVVTKNMIFKANYLADSSYCVYCFDEKGDFTKEESAEDLGREFFQRMKTIKTF